MAQSAPRFGERVVPYRRERQVWNHKLWLMLAILFALGANYADSRGIDASRLWIYAAVFAFLTVTAFWCPGVDDAPTQIGVAGFTGPWMTAGLIAVISAVFALEQQLPVAPPVQPTVPALTTLVAFGGLSRSLAESGQWWRMLTAPFLHGSLAHLVGNVLALFFAGAALERFAGRTWMLCIYVTGALAGSAGSLIFNAPATVSVGASGAIMALIAATFIMSLRLPAGGAKARMQAYCVRIAIPALVPPAQAAAVMHIDYGAHAGGAACGVLLGLLMLVTWPAGSPLPRLRSFAAAIAAAGVTGCGLSAFAIAWEFQSYAGAGPLIPAAELAKPQELRSTPDKLLTNYPDDPRSYMFAALARLNARKYAEAERFMREALAKTEAQPWRFQPMLHTAEQAELAEILLKEGSKQEAQSLAQEACATSGPAALTPALRKELTRSGLCSDAGR